MLKTGHVGGEASGFLHIPLVSSLFFTSLSSGNESALPSGLHSDSIATLTLRCLSSWSLMAHSQVVCIYNEWNCVPGLISRSRHGVFLLRCSSNFQFSHQEASVLLTVNGSFSRITKPIHLTAMALYEWGCVSHRSLWILLLNTPRCLCLHVYWEIIPPVFNGTYSSVIKATVWKTGSNSCTSNSSAGWGGKWSGSMKSAWRAYVYQL